MFSINIQGKEISLNDIRSEHLPLILGWYNKTDEFKYATGIYAPMKLEELRKRFKNINISNTEFFAGIYINNGTIIGIIKGSIQYQNKNAVWISSIVIDNLYQNKGYGSIAVDLLIKHIKSKIQATIAYLVVVEDNEKGKQFWIRQKFRILKSMEKHLGIQKSRHSVIIMYKRI